MKLRTTLLALLPLGFAAVGVSQPADERSSRSAGGGHRRGGRRARQEAVLRSRFEVGLHLLQLLHNLSMGGSDNLQTSIGDHWQRGPINSPTVLNSSMSWRSSGTAGEGLKEQARRTDRQPREMAFSHQLAIQVIASIRSTAKSSHAAFGGGSVDIERVKEAIAAFEETLVTPNSRFDRWLQAMRRRSPPGARRLSALKDIGCVRCHNGRRRAHVVPEDGGLQPT